MAKAPLHSIPAEFCASPWNSAAKSRAHSRYAGRRTPHYRSPLRVFQAIPARRHRAGPAVAPVVGRAFASACRFMSRSTVA